METGSTQTRDARADGAGTNGDGTTDLHRTRNLLLMALTVASGSVDAMSFLALGNVFTGFMTGNGIFLGLIVSGAGTQSTVSVGAAIVAFAAGVFLATRIVSPTTGSHLWPRAATAALGVTVIAQACFFAAWLAAGPLPTGSVGGLLLLLIALWAIGMGVQTRAVMSLGLPGVFTTAATATLATFVSDIAAPQSATTEMRRLLGGVLVSLVVGAVVGGLLLTYASAWAPLFPLAVTVLVVATATFVMPKPGAAKSRRSQ